MTELVVDTAIDELPPSAKLVYLLLKETGPATMTELARQGRLSERTTRRALRQLVEAGVVEDRQCITDARKRVYSLSG